MPAAKSLQSGLLDAWGRRNRLLSDRACLECGSSFRPVRSASSYCSRPCARKKNGGQNVKLETWWLNSKGYIEGKIWTAQGQRRVKRHRFLVECRIGRLLAADEHVHHLNGDKRDNRQCNLQLLSAGEHSRLHNLARSAAKALGQQVQP